MVDIKIALWLRVLMLVSAAVALMSGTMLTLWPDRTVDYFAWEIKNPMTAVLMGAGYLSIFLLLGVIPLLTGFRWSKNWMLIATGSLFTGLLGVATFLHTNIFLWDRFGAWMWAVLYAVIPPLFVFGWWWHSRRSGAEPPSGPPLHPLLRPVLTAVAALQGVLGLGLFLFPELLGGIWPWSLTPLTARVVATWPLCFSLFSAIASRARYWGTIRLPLAFTTAWPLMLLLNGLRFGGSFTGGISQVVYYGALLLWLVGVGYLVMYHERQAVHTAADAAQAA